MKTETRVGIFIVIAMGVFIYLSVNIGALRLDKAQYHTYRTYFDDTGGLDVKAPIKIAGVDVGWVETIDLQPDGKAEIKMRVSKSIKLAKNSYAVIAQEGLIGAKTLILEPGDPSTGLLLPGSTLSMPGKSPVTISDLLEQFKDIATNVQDIAASFKNVFATPQGEGDMKIALKGLAKAADRMGDFSEILERTMRKNEENVNAILLDFRSVASQLDQAIPSIRKDINDTLPSFRNNFDRLTLAMADDTLPAVSGASKKVDSAFVVIEDAAGQARETFREAEQVAEKINTGKGVLGKLVNEDETYDDIKKTVRGLKDYVTRAQSLVIDVDMHSETLLSRDWNSKGYFELKLRPNQDYFYLFQMVADQRGSISRGEEHRKWYDQNGNLLDVNNLDYGTGDEGKAQKAHDQMEFSRTIQRTKQIKDDILFGFQFGKRFNRLALRVGLFEGTFGLGCDYYVPMQTDKLHWITSLEAFDFKGTKRYDPVRNYDDRPYIRWVNKVFFLKHLYTCFGVDDMIGKHTSGPFWGGGLRFNDDDLKYVFSVLPIGKLGGSGGESK